MSKPLEWTTQQRKVNDLVPLEINPRKISESHRMKMIESLQKFNLVDIPVIDTDGTVISGHQRLRALQAIGRGDELIDVRVPNRKLTTKEVKEYNLLANTHYGEFDFELLDVFSDIDNDLVPIDIKKIEFEQSDMFQPFMNKFEKEKEKAAQPVAHEDDYEMPDEIKTDIVPGDIFDIGPHRLMCGDSTDSDAVASLMNGEKADMIFTDPPYGVSIGKKNVMLNSFQKSGRNLTDIEDDDLSESQLDERLSEAFRNLYINSADHCSYYVCAPQGGNLGLMMMMMMMSNSYTAVKHVLNWVKNSPTFSMGRLDYDYQHEPILFGWKKTHKRIKMGQFQTSIWSVNKPRANKEHPTMKPVELPVNAILNSSDVNDIIVDIYIGSGTTMVASHQTNRRCYAMEISPNYCQVIIDRMLKLDPTLTIKRNGQPWITPKTS